MGWTWDVSGRVKMTPFGYLWHNILICMSLSFCISCFQFRSSFCLILPAALYFFILATWVAVLVIQSCLTLCNPMDYIAHQAPQSMEFSRQEYWNGLPLPSPGDLSDPGIEPRSPALQADSLPLSHWGSLFIFWTSLQSSRCFSQQLSKCFMNISPKSQFLSPHAIFMSFLTSCLTMELKCTHSSNTS